MWVTYSKDIAWSLCILKKKSFQCIINSMYYNHKIHWVGVILGLCFSTFFFFLAAAIALQQNCFVLLHVAYFLHTHSPANKKGGSYDAESKTFTFWSFILKRLYDLVAVFTNVSEKGFKMFKFPAKGKRRTIHKSVKAWGPLNYLFLIIIVNNNLMCPRISELIIIDFCDDFRTGNSHPGLINWLINWLHC